MSLDKEQLAKALVFAKEISVMDIDKNPLHENEIKLARALLQLSEEILHLRSISWGKFNEYHWNELEQERDELRVKLQQAEADNAALVQALEFYAAENGGMLAREALSTPHPGQALLDELTKLRVVAEASKYFDFPIMPYNERDFSCMISFEKAWALKQALAALDKK